MAVGIVHQLDTVQVYVDEGMVGVHPAGGAIGLIEQDAELAAVWQAGQRIGRREALEFLFGTLAKFDIAHGNADAEERSVAVIIGRDDDLNRYMALIERHGNQLFRPGAAVEGGGNPALDEDFCARLVDDVSQCHSHQVAI